MTYTSALIVGAGSGLSASLARAVRQSGHERRAGRALGRQARRAGAGDRRARLHLRRQPTRRRSRNCSPISMPRSSRPMSSSTTPATARAGLSPNSIRRSGQGTSSHRLRRFPGGAGGGAPHAAARPRRHPVHRRFGQREGLCAVGAFRHGQICPARFGAEHGARIASAGHPRRAFRHRRRHQQRAPCRPPDKPDALLDPDAIAASYLHRARPAAQRLDAGARAAALGREILRRFAVLPCESRCRIAKGGALALRDGP